MPFPNSNLAATSQPWARDVQKRVESLESNVKANEINNTARDVQLSNSLARVSRIIDSVFVPGTNSINGFNIEAGTISAGAISAGTFQTSTTGQRVVMSDLDNIRFYNSNGSLTTEMEGTAAFSSNTFAVRSAIQSLNTEYLARYAGSAVFLDDDFISISTQVQTGAAVTNVTVAGSIGMQLSTGLSLSSEVAIALDAPGIDLNGLSISSTGVLGNITTGDINAADLDVDSIYSSGEINSDGNIFGASVSAKNNGVFYGGSTSLSGQMASGSISTGSIGASEITASGSIIRSALIGGGSTTASITNAGAIVRTASSARYKQDIENATYTYEDVLSLQPKSFRLKDEVAEDDNARRYAGFIAEEIAGTPLDIFVAYQTLDDGTRRPDGVYYAELTSALISAIKHQDSLIKSLDARLEALENK